MIEITIDLQADAEMLRRIRDGLAERTQLHARIADEGEEFTKQYVRNRHGSAEEHQTANRLGANPTGHLLSTANQISSVSDGEGATLRFPRASRLRAAFGSYTVRPKGGRKYLTIPAHKLTYGKRAGSFGDQLEFRLFSHRHRALVFKESGEIAYWLKPEVTIKEDRGLLPFDQLPKLTRRVAESYIAELASEGGVA